MVKYRFLLYRYQMKRMLNRNGCERKPAVQAGSRCEDRLLADMTKRIDIFSFLLE